MDTDKKKPLLYFGIFFGSMILLWIFLILTAMIPNILIQKNMQKSALAYANEDAFVYSSDGRLYKTADNYADAIWLNIAWYMGNGNPVVSTVDTRYYDGEELGENVGLYLAVNNEETVPNTDYTRYWHGTAGIIRILHLFTDVNGIKNIGLAVTMLLAAILMGMLIKDKKGILAIALFISLCMVQFWNIRLSMEYQPAFIISLFMCILFLKLEKKGDSYLLMLSVAGGVLIAFFDFLTTETMVILLPLILVVTVRSMDKRAGAFKEIIKPIFTDCLAWLGAYGGSFLIKWSLASVITGENKFTAAIHSAKERVDGITLEMNGMNLVTSIFAAPAANVSVLFGAKQRIDIFLIVMGILLLLGIVVWMLYFFPGKERNKAATGALLLLGSMILIRYMVLRNHSYLHAFFTYRGLISLIMAVFSVIVINCDIGKGNCAAND